jgi:hypothetical protein
MNPSTASVVRPRRRVWPWILGGAVFCMAMAVASVVSCFGLDRDAAALHRRVAAVFGDSLHRRVQLSVGLPGVTAARMIVHSIDDVPPEARQALAAVKSASVGVYELDAAPEAAARARLLREADEAMNRRGWSRVVGVADGDDTVAVYADPEADADDSQRVCVLVCDHRNVVIVAARADPAPLVALAVAHRGALAIN